MTLLSRVRKLKTFCVRYRWLRRLVCVGQPFLRFCWISAQSEGRLAPACSFSVGTLRIDARPADVAALEEVLVLDEYRIALDLLPKDGPAPVVVDLGANIGTVSALVFKQRADAQVVSVEAGPETFAVLDANRAANPGYAWTAIHAAAAGTSGTLRFSCGPLSTGGRVGGEQGVEVPARTLVDLLPPGPIALLKVDIEGAEEALLRAGESCLPRVAAMVIELHPGRCDTDACLALLKRNFTTVEPITGRRSFKPVLIARR